MRYRRLDLNLLIALDALLSDKSVTKAAAKLNITQPAMSGALARLRASTIAAYIYLQPLLSVGLGVWQLGERPTETAALAGASILVGLGLVIWR